MPNRFRYNSPIRTCTKTYKNYRSFKPYLATDFNSRCGYTDCPDFWFGGKNNFHIDHFKPFSKNPELETEYSNLVYSCSYVNILKSDDEGDYIDPCDVDFNNHFTRASDGTITPMKTSKEANYMHSKLQLGLSRYSLIWKLDEIRIRIDKIITKIKDPKNSEFVTELRIIHSELAEEFFDYLKYLNYKQ